MIISGAASGIGLATARLVAGAGATVAMLDRDAAAVSEAAARIAGEDGSALAIQCDVSDRDQVEAAVEQVTEQFGAPDGLVTAAGIEKGAPSHLVSPADWRQTLEVNLTGTFLLCQAVLSARLAAGSGATSIVCVSSPAAFVGFAAGQNAAYSASKGGVSALVRTLAVEYAAHGVRVNAVVPGATETPLMWANVADEDVEEVRRGVAEAVPLGRLAEPGEVAEAISWLLGDGSRYVTGTHLVCDGGLLAKATIAV
ncbi:D-threitol dehydrogenase [Nonomuraea antimicrobica]|uniref:D-threitol dehydrogenase n=1 Tax=Nonomuraea antimicrobica TaxID=561173 RepID=A0ABP7CZ33_9ACTN